MAEAKGVSTPAIREERDNHKDDSGKVPYREAVGSFIYLGAATCPDIAFANAIILTKNPVYHKISKKH